MKTDALFYELFQLAPETFFELLQVTPPCTYRFESITVKTSEKRIDGVFEPAVAGQPIYFLEVQGFPDDVIYFRSIREVTTYFEQRSLLKDNGWQAAVLWLNKADDPGFGTLRLLARKPKPRLVSLDLIQLLRQLPEDSLALNVLRPLLVTSEREIREHVVEWVDKIRRTPNLDANAEEKLISVMSQLIEQKFRHLTYKELRKMLRLRPLVETISGQELLKEERVETLLRLIQRKFVLTPETLETITADLQKLRPPTLRVLLDQIFEFATLEDLERRIAEQLTIQPPADEEVEYQK